jgi:hypothetical protein
MREWRRPITDIDRAFGPMLLFIVPQIRYATLSCQRDVPQSQGRRAARDANGGLALCAVLLGHPFRYLVNHLAAALFKRPHSVEWRLPMKRTMISRRILMALALFGTAVAITAPQSALAQTNLGKWKLNLAKSTYNPGPAPRSQTLNFEGTGQELKDIVDGIDAQGKPITGVYIHIYDGKFYPTTGAPGVDSTAYTRVDPNVVKFTRMNAGKVIQTGFHVVSSDGKTLTVITTGTDANGREINTFAVFEKQ